MTHPSRRAFIERLGACVAGGAAFSQSFTRNARAQSVRQSYSSEASTAPTSPPKFTNPNILVIMVDQMRWPVWLTTQQRNLLETKFLPNIFGRLRNQSYVFEQYYTAATVCTAARGTLLTGLYAPQTAAYLGPGDQATPAPPLNPAFPTWSVALPQLNPAYKGNLWWFGKWHLSRCSGSSPLAPYAFNTRTYPGGAAGNPSPDGSPNEGSNGGTFGNSVRASDAQIAGDFIGWLQNDAPATAPWCATVSLINPHDIVDAPGWTTLPVPKPSLPPKSVWFPPVPFPPNGLHRLYTADPIPWNFEDPEANQTIKPAVQYWFWKNVNTDTGPVTNWVQFLNQYFWLQALVDEQIGLVLTALENSTYSTNTVVIFLADHGEYAGSHGLHDKGYAVYDESIHVPLYVHLPGQTASIRRTQMCSSVDFFGLLCDFATAGGGLWRQAYPSLASRQSLWNFIYHNSLETRVSSALGVPYVFHTCDRANPQEPKFHIVCLRTKTDPTNSNQPGAKLAIYSAWAPCTTVPDGSPPDYEFYDYNPATPNNTSEMGNDYTNPASQDAIAQYEAALGNWGPPGTGLIASELYAPLIGNGTDGNPLTLTQASAQRDYVDFVTPTCAA